MKKIKKLLAMLMAMTMVLGMSVTVFAADPTPTPGDGTVTKATGKSGDTATITVGGIKEGADVYAFQIVKANYKGTGGLFSEYEKVYGEISFEKNNFKKSGTELAEELAKVQAKFTYDSTNKTWSGVENNAEKVTLANGYTTMTRGTDGAYTAEVPVGSYLVVVKNEGTSLYSPIVVSVSYVADAEGNPEYDEGTVNIVTQPGWVKVTTDPKIEKTAASTNTDTHSVNVGDVVTYTVKVDNIPNYTGANPVFNVTDKLDEGLSYVLQTPSDSTSLPAVTVKVTKKDKTEETLTLGTGYTLRYEEQDGQKNLVVDFVKTVDTVDTYLLKGYEEGSLTITYKAKVTNTDTSKIKMNFDGNENTATLKYTTDSTIKKSDDPDGPNPTDKTESKAYSYTFDLSTIVDGTNNTATSLIQKTGEMKVDNKTEQKPLKDAVFTLYTNDDLAPNHIYKNDIIKDGTVKSGDKGELNIKGLAAGTYYLKETEAPAGYSINETVYQIIITPTYHAADVTGSDSTKYGQLKEWTVTVNGKAANADAFTKLSGGGTMTSKEEKVSATTIANTQLASLPSTGGIGTTIFTFGGCALMILAAALYFVSRRRTAK